MKKIVLIEPQAPNLHIFSQFPLPRLGILILGTMMRERGWEVEIFFEDLRRIDFDAIAAAHLVGISTITSTAPRAYAIADRVRAMGMPGSHGWAACDLPRRRSLGARRFRHPGRRRTSAHELDRRLGTGDLYRIPNLSFRAADGRSGP